MLRYPIKSAKTPPTRGPMTPPGGQGGLEDSHGIPHMLAGSGGRHNGQSGGDESGDPSLDQAKGKKLGYVLGKGHEEGSCGKAEDGSYEHHPPAITVPQPAPEGPGKDGQEKGGSVDEAAPPLHVLQFPDSQFPDIEGKKGKDQGHAQNGQEFHRPEAV